MTAEQVGARLAESNVNTVLEEAFDGANSATRRGLPLGGSNRRRQGLAARLRATRQR